LDRIGIISPLLPEAACLGPRPRPGMLYTAGSGISILVSGMGAERAARAAEDLVHCGMGLLISWGTAGALAADLQAGDLIIPEEVISGSGRSCPTDRTLRTTLLGRLDECPGSIFLGRLYNVSEVLKNSTEKMALHQKYKALAVDMESAAIGTVAARHGVPFMVIRVITDTLSVPVPQAVLKCTGPYGNVRIPALLFELIKQPGEIIPLARLASAFRQATKTLRWIGSRKEQILTF